MSAATWCVIAVGLLILELVLPTGFYLVMLGGAAVGVAAVSALAPVLLGTALTVTVQLFVFAGFALLLCLVVAPVLQKLIHRKPKITGDPCGVRVRVLQDLPVDGEGRAELWGSNWQVKNMGPVPIKAGAEVVVVAVVGVTLFVMAE
jgi:membrane protein implicated in regulation of membrane protease activity